MVVIVIDYFNCNRDYFSRLLLKLVEHFLFFLNTMDTIILSFHNILWSCVFFLNNKILTWY